MKHIKSYNLFESIQTDKFDIGIENDFEVLKEILYDLKFDYFDISYITTCNSDETLHTFNALVRSILKWEKTNSFKSQELDPISHVENIIIASIERDSEFYYKEIKNYVEDAISFMTSKGWRYLIEPVANDTSIGYYLCDLKHFDRQKMVSLHVKFYC
jgi:hypothetical protein